MADAETLRALRALVERAYREWMAADARGDQSWVVVGDDADPPRFSVTVSKHVEGDGPPVVGVCRMTVDRVRVAAGLVEYGTSYSVPLSSANEIEGYLVAVFASDDWTDRNTLKMALENEEDPQVADEIRAYLAVDDSG